MVCPYRVLPTWLKYWFKRNHQSIGSTNCFIIVTHFVIALFYIWSNPFGQGNLKQWILEWEWFRRIASSSFVGNCRHVIGVGWLEQQTNILMIGSYAKRVPVSISYELSGRFCLMTMAGIWVERTRFRKWLKTNEGNVSMDVFRSMDRICHLLQFPTCRTNRALQIPSGCCPAKNRN